MRATVFLVVVALHIALFFVFAVRRGSAPGPDATESPTVAFFLPLAPAPQTIPAEPEVPRPTATARAAARTNRPAAFAPPQPETEAISPPAAAAPDWPHELEIAANNQLQSAARQRSQPSPLAPHDFSKVKPGSTDDSRPEFGWSHSATHRVEELPSGGLLINLNDRCAIAWVIFPFPVCRIGKIPARGDLFDHLKDTPQP
jgi:hypothetical protein